MTEHHEHLPAQDLGPCRYAVKKESAPAAIMMGLTEPFMIPYALALGASVFQAGMLSSIRNLILSLVQIKSADAIHKLRSRKRLILWTAGIQAVLWIPTAFVAPLFGAWAVTALILLYTLGTSSSAFGGPAWGSLVSEYLPTEERGAFFGQRALVVGLWTTGAGLLAGLILHTLSERPVLGFGILCLTASLYRFVSYLWLNKLVEIPMRATRESPLTLRRFLRRVRTDNFVRYVFLMALFNGMVNVAAPYLAIYMLDELHYSYMTYTVVILAGTLIGNLIIPAWGRLSDAHGNEIVLRWSMLPVALLPFLWIVSPHPVWLLLTYLVSGVMWGGLNLSMVNFIYDAAPPDTRAHSIAYFNVINGVCISLGTLAGGWILEIIPAFHGSFFLSLFILSGVLRTISVLIFHRFVKEVRAVRQIGLREVVFDLMRQRVIQILGYSSDPSDKGKSS